MEIFNGILNNFSMFLRMYNVVSEYMISTWFDQIC